MPRDGVGPSIWFNRVPEPKQGKNRVHLDVYGDVGALVARGTLLLQRQPECRCGEYADW
jgi:hypothetical protein